MDDHELWELEAEMDESLRREQEAQAGAERRAGMRGQRFLDRLRELPTGEVVAVVTVDGALVRGRVLSVGADFVTLGETGEPVGAARARLLRVHEVPLAGMTRVVREP